MNMIMVIRFSDTGITNFKLADALAGLYIPGSLVYPIPDPNSPGRGVGVISCLITGNTFDDVVLAVRNSDCGENCLVIDHNSMVHGHLRQEFVEFNVTEYHVDEMTSEQISKEISRLLAKGPASNLTQAEASRLTELINSTV